MSRMHNRGAKQQSAASSSSVVRKGLPWKYRVEDVRKPLLVPLRQFSRPSRVVASLRSTPLPSQGRAPSARAAAQFTSGCKLHIGCGRRRLAGWVNADAVPGIGDVVFDLHDDLPYDTFAMIYGSHVLEHCWPQDTPRILKTLRNALQPGGTLRLSVPDIRLVMKNCIDGHAYGDERSALAVIYGGDFAVTTAGVDLHRQTFWKERLERLLHEAGFVNVRTWRRGQYPEIDALSDYATHPAGPDGQSLISLNMEADRPVEAPRPRMQPAPVPAQMHSSRSTSTPTIDTPRSTIEVSILLGTVNRPQMLRDCVEAVRKAVSGFSYEIVVAYGTNDEPSLPWMRQQNDLVPILGGMNGAIEAFNHAYEASRGRFICQINDDVLVDGDAIARAVRHLHADLSSAGVVFKFDRGDDKGYRHEKLGGVLHPNQMVVRRDTCEAVVERIGAFWGDAKHRTDKTYGGDSAFGAMCRHLGLRLDSVDGVTCRDLLAPDELRERNQKSVAANHGQRWGAMYDFAIKTTAPSPGGDEWPRCYVPRHGTPPRRSPVEAGRPLRLLMAPIVVSGWPQTAMIQEFSRIGPTLVVRHEGDAKREIVEAMRRHQPDVVFVQIQRDGWDAVARELRAVAGTNCTLVQWSGDVRTDAGQPIERWWPDLCAHFDIVLADNCTYPKKLAQLGAKAAGYLSHGCEGDLGDLNVEETGGAVFVGNNYAHLDGGTRSGLFRRVERELPGVLSIYGAGWNMGCDHGPVAPSAVGPIIRRAAVTIAKSLYSNLERYTSNRLKNAMAAGGVVAVKRFSDMEGLGLVPGQNCLAWSSPDELLALLADWTRPERASERKAIRGRARALAMERFTWRRSVEELLAIVRDHRARKGLA